MEKQNTDFDRDIALGLKMFFVDHGSSYHTAASASGLSRTHLMRILNGEISQYEIDKTISSEVQDLMVAIELKAIELE